jgi:hypothetical protein
LIVDSISSIVCVASINHVILLQLGLPVVQTIKLTDFRMIFPPRPKARRSNRAPKLPSKDILVYSKGFLAMELPSDDEDDAEWDENNASLEGADEGGDAEETLSSSEDSDNEYSDDEESELDEKEQRDLIDEENDNMDIDLDEEDEDDDLFTEVKVSKRQLKNLSKNSTPEVTSTEAKKSSPSTSSSPFAASTIKAKKASQASDSETKTPSETKSIESDAVKA